MPKLIIIRGLPGSGKSKAAEYLSNTWKGGEALLHFETDMFFTNKEGTYGYRVDLLQVAHQWCQRETKRALREGLTAIVSNTFSQYWEMISYLKLAHKYGAKVEIHTCKGQFPNIHGVPNEVIQKMKERWED